MKIFHLCITFSLTLHFFNSTVQAQNKETGDVLPQIQYDNPKRYTIADIRVTGIQNYEDFTLIGFSGLSVGDVVTIPGKEITAAIKRFWRHGLFSDVKILATKVETDSVWLEIQLKQRPRISEVHYNGIKKSEREDLEKKLSLRKGLQTTPNLIDRAKILIQKYFDTKGFKNVDVEIIQREDLSTKGDVILTINIDKKLKTKIHQIHISGNLALTDHELKKAMKKTNEKFSLTRHFKTSILEMFSTKKFTTEEFEKDKKNIIDKYNEYGYRDAVLLSDSVTNYNEKTVDIYLTLEEGRKFYLKDVRFIGNTKYSTDVLNAFLNMKAGDVYNQTKLTQRLSTDEDAVSNIYFNNGYLFFNADPVEVEVENDSILLEIRIQEGPQATINRVIINGNDRLYEDMVRRELRTKPGTLFNREELIRSVREIAQMGHFDPEQLNPLPIPDPENGTVDIQYNLVSKANDQFEFSFGYGQTGLIGKVGLKFTNFSLSNFLRPGSYRGIIPQGEGQTVNINAQTNGRFYQSYGFTYLDPWFGGKRPNTLSFSAYYSKMTGVDNRFYNRNLYSQYYPGNYENAYDTNKYMKNFSFSLGYGKRLNWPDDYFQFMATMSYQIYKMKNWDYYMNFINNGVSHNINLELLLQRSSINNPIYPRRGSHFALSVTLTPPYSLFDGKDYASMPENSQDKFKLIEYHKWKFKSKMFVPLAPLEIKRTPVLMARVDFGILGSYNKHKKSPFENFYVGGDMSAGGSYSYGVETVPMRGYSSGSLGTNAYAYTKIGMELRYPVMLEPSSTIYVLGFLEGGNAWNNIKDMNPFDLKRSAGFGVRIMLPMIGLMGIDWTYGFDAVNGSRQNSGSQFQFVLGQEF